MKKLFVLLLLCFIQSLKADSLSDAIRTSNVEEVRSILASQTFTNQQMMKYLDTAEQIIRLRRDNVALAKISLTTAPLNNFLNAEAIYMECAAISGALIASGFVSLICSGNRFVKSASINVMGVSFVAFLASFFAGVINGYQRAGTMHDDAILIKEMLHDHFRADPIISTTSNNINF